MGMFGNSVGGGGMFGVGGSPTRSPYETPGYGGGVNFEQIRQQMPQQQPMQQQPQQQGYAPRKLSFSDRLMMFGEALQGRDTTRQRLSEQDMAEQRYQRQRADSASDDERNFQQQMQIAQYQRENPAPLEIERYIAMANDPNNPNRAVFQDLVQNRRDPFASVPTAEGLYVGPRSGIPGMGNTQQPAPQGGGGLPPGYTVRPRGGAPSQGGGTFRP